MARSALTAPAHVVLQRSPGQFGTASTVQPDSAISMDYLGGGLLDHRMPWNKYNSLGNGALAGVVGWANGMFPAVLDQTIANAPATTTGGVVAAANTTSGTAMTLSTATTLTNGVLVTAAALTTYPFGTVIPASTLVVQSQMSYSVVGIRDITAAYDPTNACTRALQVSGVTSGAPAGGVMLVKGFDIYGQPMTESIVAPTGAATVIGKKAWKWITSITPNFTDAHNYTVDVTNFFGLHLAVDTAAYVDAWIAGTGYTTNPSVTAAVTSVPSSTTGDVRGLLSLTPGSNRITVFVTPSNARLMINPNGGATSGLSGIFGLVNA